MLEAIRRRDAHASRLLAQRWVHRSGLAAFDDFRTRTLLQMEGEAASSWLNDQLKPPALPNASDRPILEQAPGLDIGLPRKSPLQSDAVPEQRVFAAVDAAIAAMLASFPEESASGLLPRPALDLLDEPEQQHEHEAFLPTSSEPATAAPGEPRWRQLPGAARLIEVARLGHEAASRWRQKRLSSADLDDLNPAGCQGEAEPDLPDIVLGLEAAQQVTPEPERRQPLSAAGRLQQQLSRSREARVVSIHAPRPAGLAELEAWLPDADLPQAS